VSCACEPLSYNGSWSPDLDSLPSSPSPPSERECFDLQCENVTNGVLFASSLICYGTPITLYTYEAILTSRLSESCVSLSVYVASGHIYSEPTQSPLALSFLQTNFDLAKGNPFAVVTNKNGVIVGDIHSSMIRLEIDNFSSSGEYILFVSPCILLDPTVGGNDETTNYDVYDLGVLFEDGTIQPLGMEAIGNRTNNQSSMICFGEVVLTERTMSLILIKRVKDFENMNTYSHAEEAIVLTSGALFSFGAILVVTFHIFTTFNLPIFILGVQSFGLLCFRGIYFFILATEVIEIGGLVDFALIEIPTFIYIGIFLQIIFPSYRFFFNRKVSLKILGTLIWCHFW